MSLIFLFFSALASAADLPRVLHLPLGAGVGEARISLKEEDNSVDLLIRLPNGEQQEEAGLGEEPVPFSLDGKEEYLAALDLDQDGQKEFALRVSVPPQAGALYFFRWNGKKFAPVPAGKEDFLLVDLAAPVKVSKSGVVTAMAPVQTKKGRRMETLRWQYAGGKFTKK